MEGGLCVCVCVCVCVCERERERERELGCGCNNIGLLKLKAAKVLDIHLQTDCFSLKKKNYYRELTSGPSQGQTHTISL